MRARSSLRLGSTHRSHEMEHTSTSQLARPPDSCAHCPGAPGTQCLRRSSAGAPCGCIQTKVWGPVQVIVLLCINTTTAPLATPPTASYVVVIDCGSSGSRVTAFRVTHTPTSTLPKLTPIAPAAASVPSTMATEGLLTERVQTTPGIAAAYQADTRWGIRHSLRPLLEWAETAIPAELHDDTALLLCATAGVRALPAKEQSVRPCLELLTMLEPERHESHIAQLWLQCRWRRTLQTLHPGPCLMLLDGSMNTSSLCNTDPDTARLTLT